MSIPLDLHEHMHAMFQEAETERRALCDRIRVAVAEDDQRAEGSGNLLHELVEQRPDQVMAALNSHDQALHFGESPKAALLNDAWLSEARSSDQATPLSLVWINPSVSEVLSWAITGKFMELGVDPFAAIEGGMTAGDLVCDKLIAGDVSLPGAPTDRAYWEQALLSRQTAVPVAQTRPRLRL